VLPFKAWADALEMAKLAITKAANLNVFFMFGLFCLFQL
jgi:hypothetical protein